MALVNVVNMAVLENPTCFTNPFQFEITFECLQELDDDLEWKVLYVGSAQDSTKDQVLDEILVGPVPVGINKFVLQADAPDPTQLSQEDLLGVTVVLVTCSYKDREFVRVGYYVNNEYHDPNAPPPPQPVQPQPSSSDDPNQQQQQQEAPTKEPEPPVVPNPVPLQHIQRQILADKPRVTKFPISWGDEPQQQQQNATNVGGDGTTMEGMMMMNTTSNENQPPLPSAAAAHVVSGNVVSPPNHYGSSANITGGGVVDMQEESNLSHGSMIQ